MRIATCQFAAQDDPEANAATIDGYAAEASARGARLLLAPESALVRLPDPEESVAQYAQPLDVVAR